ncbi:MAG: DUF3572 family protein [Sphingomonadaceae bacterium]
MPAPDTNAAHATALRALVWTLQDSSRSERMLALTGLDGAAIRARIEDPALLGAVIDFLEAHEPDLIACAKAIEVSPLDLLAARTAL